MFEELGNIQQMLFCGGTNVRRYGKWVVVKIRRELHADVITTSINVRAADSSFPTVVIT